MAITALTDVETLEVSLVPQGANKKKRFPVLKSAEKNMSDILHAVIDAPSSEDNRFDQVVKSSSLGNNPEAAEAVIGALKILNAYSDSVSPAEAVGLVADGLGVEKGMYEKGSKYEEKAEEEEEEAEVKIEMTEEEEETKKEEEEETEKAEHEEEETEKEEHEEEETEKAEEDEEEKEDVEKSLKSLPENVRNQMTALFKSQKEAIAKADKLEKALKVERDERLRKDFIAKAQKDFPYVPGKSPEEVGLMLKSLHSVAPKIAEDVENIFKSVSATIEKTGLLTELGSGMSSGGDSASAYGKLDGIARQAVTKSGVSYAKAFETAMNQNPELYTAYLNEQAK
jgi:chemotaxis protein histidine kinase CheA